jgi:S-adenosylmethionine synthetase
MKREYLLSSESVSEGHPDKLADQISDAVLDAAIEQDQHSRVACETLVTQGMVVLAGEITSKAKINIERIARAVIRDAGYSDQSCGMDCKCCAILSSIHGQAVDIARGVFHTDGSIGAGDQGSMFGYATNETPELMPLAISLAHKLMMRQAELRKSGTLDWLRPDAKSQVTVKYADASPIAVSRVVFSTQHSPDIETNQIREAVVEEIIHRVIPHEWEDKDIQYIINPSGQFVTGGPAADTGLTGRKIMVDSYGASCRHGGGAFSGKDPTKVDRSAAYMARYIAKNIVASGIACRCTVQLAYAIGRTDPVSLMIDLHGTGMVDEDVLVKHIPRVFRLDPSGIIESLDLRRPIYSKTAAYGHFGRELPEFTWENTGKADTLGDLIGYRRQSERLCL